MAIYTIGDLHLSLGGNHSMEVFPGWENYVARIAENWKETVGEDDAVVLVGDTSWGLTLQEALPDFQFLEALPGKKILLKGNHDYWWSTKAKISAFFEQNGLNSFEVLHNDTIVREQIALCGSRGWLLESGKAADVKIIQREAIRLELSLQAGEKTGLPVVCFLHYPPVYGTSECAPIFDVLERFAVSVCYYGHIHASGYRWAIDGTYRDIRFYLVSSDYRHFRLMRVETEKLGVNSKKIRET